MLEVSSNISKMTCQQARDWLAQDDGFVFEPSENVVFPHWRLRETPCLDIEGYFEHPYKATLEAAILELPSGCDWGKSPKDGIWYISHKHYGSLYISDNFGCDTFKASNYEENDSGYLYRLIVAMRIRIKDSPHYEEPETC